MTIIKQIIHLDLDAFYASVEILDNPSLKGKPVIVGSSSLRGVVSAASYQARKFGVHSAMPIAWARRKCPQGVFLPVRMERYQEISKIIFKIYKRFTPLVEPLSLDEAFLDISGTEKIFGPADKLAQEIKNLVYLETGLTVSAGLSSKKFLAKIASDFQKPNGLTIVEAGKELEFLHPLPLKSLWGVGKVTQKKLEKLGLKTIGDLSKLDKNFLEKEFGKSGTNIWYLAQGIDKREVEVDREVKSLGSEETFASDLISLEIIQREILRLSFKVARQLNIEKLQGRTVTLKLKNKDFKQITRSKTLNEPINDHNIIYKIANQLLLKEKESLKKSLDPLRLIGITISQFENNENKKRQEDLFQKICDEHLNSEKQKKLNEALNTINNKFGEKSILPASILK